MTLMETFAAGVAALSALSGGVYVLNRRLKNDGMGDKREARADAVDDKVVKTLTEVIDTLRAELARNQADTERLSAAMTQLTAQLITQSNNMMVLKNDAVRVVNLLVKVKLTQDEMLKSGKLENRLWDINTDVLRLKNE